VGLGHRNAGVSRWASHFDRDIALRGGAGEADQELYREPTGFYVESRLDCLTPQALDSNDAG
jgi:hypothetical protein